MAKKKDCERIYNIKKTLTLKHYIIKWWFPGQQNKHIVSSKMLMKQFIFGILFSDFTDFKNL